MSLRKILSAGLFGILALIACMIVSTGVGIISNSEAASSYYKGKTLTMIIPHAPGGGFDTYARTILPYLEKELDAKIVPKQAKGAGGILGTNLLWRSKPDGLTFAISSIPSLLLAQLSGAQGVQYNTTQFILLGRLVTEPKVMCVGGKSEFKTIQDIVNAGRVIKYPSQGLDEDFFTAAVTAKALGFKLDQITGYEGSPDTILAVIKNEGDAHITSLATAEPVIKAGDFRPVLFYWNEKVAEYKNVPLAIDITTGESREFMEVLTNMLALHRCFFAPPGIPEVAKKELRAAVDRTMANPAVAAALAKRGKLVLYLNGEAAQKKLDRIAVLAEKITPALKEAVAAIKQ